MLCRRETENREQPHPPFYVQITIVCIFVDWLFLGSYGVKLMSDGCGKEGKLIIRIEGN
jgi:hypothetical protein